MPATVKIRTDFSASELRRLAAGSKDANQSRRLLSLAAIIEGMGRADAARIGGMDRQTLRDWVHRFNAQGPDGLKDIRSKGQPQRLSAEQLAAFSEIVETGPDRAKDGVVRWRRIDLKHVIEERFGVVYHERTIRKLLKQIRFSHISARPRHLGQNAETIAAFKTYGPPRLQVILSRAPNDQSASTYPASEHPPSQDGDTRDPVLIKLTASSAIF